VNQANEQLNLLKCPWCDVVKTLRGLACHAGKIHKQPASELHRIALHGGVVPSCACGCGEPMKWLQKKYGTFARGHNGFSDAARRSATSSRSVAHTVRPAMAIVAQAAADKGETPQRRASKKPSIAEMSGTQLCVACGFQSATHVRTTECPACGPRSTAAIASFDAFLRSLSNDLIRGDDGSWRMNGTHVFFLDAPWRYSLPGPLKSRAQVERDTLALMTAGLDVSRFYEDEWVKRPDAVSSIVRHALGLSSRKVAARACDVVELLPHERKEFMTRCHLEGDARAMIAFGLKNRLTGKIEAAITAREPFHKAVHVGKVEVARFACELGTSVPGGLSRLLKCLVAWAKSRNYTHILSYADGRLGDGASYEKNGFSRIKRGSPRLWWTDYTARFNRFKVKADSKNGITQNQRAIQEGVVELWGCGNVTFELKIDHVVDVDTV
jgi:hypothetical protein